MHGIAKMTAGGLTKIKLKYNKQGKIVSRKASNTAKKANKLVKAGYITKKGHFGVVKKGGAAANPNFSNMDKLRTTIMNNRLINYGYPLEFNLTHKYKKFKEELMDDIIEINNWRNKRNNKGKAVRLIHKILRSENYRNFMYNIEKTNIHLINEGDGRDIYNILFHISDVTYRGISQTPILNNTSTKINGLINNINPLPVGNCECYWTCFLVFSYFCNDMDASVLPRIVGLFKRYFLNYGRQIFYITDENNTMYLKENIQFNNPKGKLSEFIKKIIMLEIRFTNESIWNSKINGTIPREIL